MDSFGNPPANNVVPMPGLPGSGGSESAPPRKGGRPKGSRNKATKEIRDIAQRHGRRMIGGLARIALDADAELDARIKAMGLILAYGYGKPTEHRELTGKDGKPLAGVGLAQLEPALAEIAALLADSPTTGAPA